MDRDALPEDSLELLASVTGKRPRAVIDHILEHGHVTTEELATIYGHNHPPRAARDVREQGIPLETFRVVGSDGRSIGTYRFGNPSDVKMGRLGGRTAFPRGFKESLLETYGSRCGVCGVDLDARYLQIDHRVPYAVAGDVAFDPLDPPVEDFMLLCGSCNRSKSWSYEHCDNGKSSLESEVCKTCYWANPDAYDHISLRPSRRLAIVWTDEEVELFDEITEAARRAGLDVSDYVKSALAEVVEQDDTRSPG